MHFTYEKEADTDKQGLRQGDVLKRTDAVNQLLQTVHPYYLQQPDYRFLQVLTQSCDLERRNGQCVTRYITLAAVRPLSLVLQREIDEKRDELEREARVADAGYRQNVQHFVERLLNNNDARYFYLHEQPEMGLAESHCTFLHLSIAVRASEHYDTCLAAKMLQLRSDFQAKLGWLVGNLYSRVGTDDWVPTEETTAEFKEHVARLVNQEVLWVEKKKLQKLKAGLQGQQGPIPFERVKTILEGLIIETKQEQALNRLRTLLPEFGVADVETALKVLRSDPVL